MKGQHLISLSHLQSVRYLYKTILKLHRGLPSEIRELGDQYVKDEFRRHKDAETEQIQTFMTEWASYAINLTKQLGLKGAHLAKPVGVNLSEPDLEKFSEEQLNQLYSLYEAAKNPEENES